MNNFNRVDIENLFKIFCFTIISLKKIHYDLVLYGQIPNFRFMCNSDVQNKNTYLCFLTFCECHLASLTILLK